MDDPFARQIYSGSFDVFGTRMWSVNYEILCAHQLEKAGWRARLTVASGDQGADVIAEKELIRLVVQCKLYSSNVDSKAVQEVFAAEEFQRAQAAAVLSNMPFTRSVGQLADVNGVKLMRHDELSTFTG